MRLKDLMPGLFLCCALLLSVPALAGGVIRDEEIEQDLKTFTTPIFREAGVTPSSVRFIILDKPDLNAFVAGGQNIFLHTGLLVETKNVGELLGVVAHETGHIAHGDLIRARQTADRISLDVLVAQVLGIAAAIGAGSGQAAAAVTSAAGTIGIRAFLTHSREQETAADQAGVSFLQGAHLPLTGFLSFMEKLSSQELLPESAQSEYVRTHPLTRDRVSYLESVVGRNPGPAAPEGWEEMHARMRAKLVAFLTPDVALQDKGNSVASRYGRAIATYRKGDANKAVELLEPLIRAEPSNPYFQELKGQILFENGRVEESLPPYASAAKLAPQSGLIRTAYGHALLEASGGKKARLDEAIAQFQASLRTEDLSPQTHHMLAIAYGKEGQEGLSRLHLAEEALLQARPEFALREAKLAQAALPKSTPSALRAADIIDFAAKDMKKQKDAKKRD